MYPLSTNNDRAILLHNVPRPAGGSPLIVASDIDIRFAYPVAREYLQKSQRRVSSPAKQDTSFVEAVKDESALSQGHVSDMYALWETGICPEYLWKHYAQQEHLSVHPLADKGLFSCGAFEVKPSAWLHHLQSTKLGKLSEKFVSSFHPASQTSTMKQVTYHHVLFTFSDMTLEFITDRLSYEFIQGTEHVRQDLLSIKWGADLF